MATQTVYTLGASNISISDSESLSGISQGSGVHLLGKKITLLNNNWEAVDIEDPNANFQDSSNTQTKSVAGDYDGTFYAAGRRVEAEYTVVVQDPLGNTYTLVAFNINEPGVTSFRTVEGLAFVGGVGGFPPIGVELTVLSNQEGPSVPYASLATPPCFTSGSFVSTPDGPKVIDELEVGDLVLTDDRGAQPLRWISKTRLPAASLQAQNELRPVLIKKDAFGPGCPSRDTRVSQQHGILISGWQAALLYGEDEVLVPAKKLINDHSVVLDHADQDVHYIHLLFDQHEVVCVDDLKSESFFPSEKSDQVVPVEDEFLAIFGVESVSDINVLSARACVSDKTTKLLQASC